jgi:hypothetical protein
MNARRRGRRHALILIALLAAAAAGSLVGGDSKCSGAPCYENFTLWLWVEVLLAVAWSVAVIWEAVALARALRDLRRDQR